MVLTIIRISKQDLQIFMRETHSYGCLCWQKRNNMCANNYHYCRATVSVSFIWPLLTARLCYFTRRFLSLLPIFNQHFSNTIFGRTNNPMRIICTFYNLITHDDHELTRSWISDRYLYSYHEKKKSTIAT